jgi:hypothetical protein
MEFTFTVPVTMSMNEQHHKTHNQRNQLDYRLLKPFFSKKQRVAV